MKIKVTTIYAAQILKYIISKGNKLSTASEIVGETGITYQYCMKVMNEMKRAGLLESEQGCKGGYRLKKNPEGITVYDVINIFESENIRMIEGKEFLKNDPFKVYMDEFFANETERLKETSLVKIYQGHAMGK